MAGIERRAIHQDAAGSATGAIAAPTAGLHFTPEILQQIQRRGAEICEITLDVGLGTFQPIHAENLDDHQIHSESYEISEDAAAALGGARRLPGLDLKPALRRSTGGFKIRY